jgi:hypothetical protein
MPKWRLEPCFLARRRSRPAPPRPAPPRPTPPPAGLATLSADTATGINVEKKGVDPPLKADEELPEWLWAMASPRKPLSELRRHAKVAELSYDEVSACAAWGACI